MIVNPNDRMNDLVQLYTLYSYIMHAIQVFIGYQPYQSAIVDKIVHKLSLKLSFKMVPIIKHFEKCITSTHNNAKFLFMIITGYYCITIMDPFITLLILMHITSVLPLKYQNIAITQGSDFLKSTYHSISTLHKYALQDNITQYTHTVQLVQIIAYSGMSPELEY